MQTTTSLAGAGRQTRTLLTSGVVAGPLYILVALIQALTRQGFDILHHDVSLLSNGDLAGFRSPISWSRVCWSLRARSGCGKRCNPAQGGPGSPADQSLRVGSDRGGTLRCRPNVRLPPGTPEATAISWHGLLHFITGAVGFLGLIAACFVFRSPFCCSRIPSLGRVLHRYRSRLHPCLLRDRNSVVSIWSVIGFWIGVVLAWTWISALALRLRAELDGSNNGTNR